MMLLGEAPGNPTPHYPELIPHRDFAAEVHVLREQLKGLFAAPLIQRITETGPQAVADETIKDALVDGGAPSSLGASEQRAPQFPQERYSPRLARTERGFECLTELLHFAWIDRT